MLENLRLFIVLPSEQQRKEPLFKGYSPMTTRQDVTKINALAGQNEHHSMFIFTVTILSTKWDTELHGKIALDITKQSSTGQVQQDV